MDEIDRLRRRIAVLEASVAERSEREQDLSDQVARYESFLNINPVWFWETGKDLRFTYFSPNVTTFTGVSPEWHYGKTRAEIGIPGSISPETWQRHLETLQRREPFSDFIFQRSGPDGIKWICANGVPVFDEASVFQGYRGTGSDITDQITASSRIDTLIAAMEQLYETVVLWDQDDRLLVCNDRFREFNAAIIEHTEPGTPLEAHLRAALAKNLYPEAIGREEEWFAERMRRYRNPGEPFEVERQDGQWVLVHERRVVGGVTAATATDITDLKTVARAGREKAAILETALETIPDGIQVLDRDLNLTVWNDQLFTILEMDRDAVLQADNPRRAFFRALAERGEYGDGDPDELVAAREHYIRTMTPVRFVRQLITGKWIEGRGIPIEHGEGYVTVYRDITERRRLDRMQREFVSTVSHELRTPLTSIYGSLSLIKNGGSDLSPDNTSQLIDIAHKNCERLVSLINDILDIGKIHDGKMFFRMEPVSISDLIRNTIELNAGFGEQHSVSFEIKGRLPNELVRGDADRLVQVLTNLLSNAAKYSPPGGAVEISAARIGSCIRVSVRDWGPGIPPEFRDKIFDRFARVDSTDARAVQGTGLGLYICKAIMDQHEGVLGFETMADGGTNFYFELPIVSAAD
ncbi:MAG: hypothetical protein GKS00_06620 [Alphaproteobacteria bacterium]|nr:hypothetical protein [Alphaproteobacteria bacterium]